MDKSKEFIKNTIILFIGKFATQFMSLLLLPLYTHYLVTEDYGTVDLLQTYISLFVPILTFRIDSAVFRFLIDKRNDQNGIRKILSNIFGILSIGIVLTFIFSLILKFIVKIKYYEIVVINIIIMMISSVSLQILRGLGKNKEYSMASIITGLTTLIFNIILIMVFNFDASSILISSSLANMLCILYVLFNVNFFKLFSVKEIDKKNIKEILLYSLPMIPNSLSWWIVSVSDRTIISMFLGLSMNAIYTVSCKFSNILNSIFSIISMSWQENATLHINDTDRDNYFSRMINAIFMGFATISLLIIAILPFVYNIIIGNDYISSYEYIPILLYSNSWNVLIGLIGGIYIAKKKTKEIANTTIVSAILNIFINLILLKFIGLYAACVSTLLSYMIMSIYRYHDCQKYVKLKLNFKKIIFYTVIFILSSLIYLKGSLILKVINMIFVVVYSIVVNKNILVSIFTLMRNKVKKISKVH